LITLYAIFYWCFCSFHVQESFYNVNIKIPVCQTIGRAAAGSAGPVPTPVFGCERRILYAK